MVLRRSALVGMACGAAIAAGALAGCQNGATSEPTPSNTAAISALAEKVPTKIREDGVLLVGIDPSYPRWSSSSGVRRSARTST